MKEAIVDFFVGFLLFLGAMRVCEFIGFLVGEEERLSQIGMGFLFVAGAGSGVLVLYGIARLLTRAGGEVRHYLKQRWG